MYMWVYIYIYMIFSVENMLSALSPPPSKMMPEPVLSCGFALIHLPVGTYKPFPSLKCHSWVNISPCVWCKVLLMPISLSDGVSVEGARGRSSSGRRRCAVGTLQGLSSPTCPLFRAICARWR